MSGKNLIYKEGFQNDFSFDKNELVSRRPEHHKRVNCYLLVFINVFNVSRDNISNGHLPKQSHHQRTNNKI